MNKYNPLFGQMQELLRYRNHITVGVDRFLAHVRSVYVVWLYDNPVLAPDENSHCHNS